MQPKARHDRLLTETLGDELIVYDQRDHRAHCLSRSAAFVWREADGDTTVAQLAEAMRNSLGVTDADEELVWLALQELERADLLDTPLPDSDRVDVSRRQMMRRFATVGAASLILPLVTSIAAPTPAMAASGKDRPDDPPVREEREKPWWWPWWKPWPPPWW